NIKQKHLLIIYYSIFLTKIRPVYTTIILAGKYFGFHAIMTPNKKACCGDNTPGYTDHNKAENLNYIFGF
ncbi:MAG: hypothetical protein L0G61_01125, partial [Staphylococcus equorum]|nr:hypothetical protein [Staphylococcus equorum]